MSNAKTFGLLEERADCIRFRDNELGRISRRTRTYAAHKMMKRSHFAVTNRAIIDYGEFIEAGGVRAGLKPAPTGLLLPHSEAIVRAVAERALYAKWEP